MKTAYVIGNCQAKSLAPSLNYYSSNVQFHNLQIHSLPPAKAEEVIINSSKKIREEADFILVFPLSEKFSVLSLDRVRETFDGKPTFIINNLFFSGYHPDIVTLGTMGRRIDGPLEQYRSKIALVGFMRGWNQERVEQAYCDSIYRVLGYYDQWKNSLTSLIASDKKVDLAFAATFGQLLQKHLCLYVINHPTPIVFQEWAKFLCAELANRDLVQKRHWEPDTALMPAYFPETSVFPVFPEIASRFELRYTGSYVFKKPGFDASSFLSLKQFIASEYNGFENVGRDALLNAPQWSSIERQFSSIS